MRHLRYGFIFVLLAAVWLVADTVHAPPILVYPNFRAFTSSNAPASGYTLTFYECNTTTPKNAYTDATLSTPAANPLTLDSSGEPSTGPIYLDGCYKIVLKDENGSTIWTRNNYFGQGTYIYGFDLVSNYTTLENAVSAIGSSETTLYLDADDTLYADLTVPSNIRLVGVKGKHISTNGYTLTINGPFHAGLFQVFDTSGGGSVSFGDASTTNIYPQWWYSGSGDWDTAFQAAITAAGGSTAIVAVPPGTYDFSSGLSSDSRFTIVGLGGAKDTVLQTTSNITLLSLTGGADYSTIKGLHFLSSSDTGTGIKLYNTTYVTIQDCRIEDWSVGLHVQSHDEGTWYNSIYNTTFSSNDTAAKFDQASGATLKPNRNRFIGCTFSGSTSYHVYIDAGDTISFTKCDFNSAPTMVYTNDVDTLFTTCCFEGDATNTNVWLKTTSNADAWSMFNCTTSHGTLDIDTASYGFRHTANGQLRLFNRRVEAESASSTTKAFSAFLNGDSEDRFHIYPTGKMEWGDGTSSPDTVLQRFTTGTLQLNDSSIKIDGFLELDYNSIDPYVTISSGAVTVQQSFVRVETEAGAASDDLDTINGGARPGQILILQAYDGSHTVVIKHGTGNIYASGKTDCTLDAKRDKAMLVYGTDSTWNMISCSDNN